MKPPVIGEGASSASASSASSLPKTLGRFRIEAALGGGSFGTVYRAFDPLVGEHVALKVLRPELSKNTEQMERLRREVVLARKVDHPGVCRIHDLHQDGETLFVVMELIDGETLDSVCTRGALSPARATRMIEEVCRALAAAHDVGVLHRDIKPSNVMVRASATQRDEVTLVDFGIATTQGLEHLTRPGVALGTVGYLAPELWDGEAASTASDVFAAGVMLYGSLTLKMPWRATGMALAQQMRSVKPVPPSMFAPPPSSTSDEHKIDEALDAIVLRAISVDPRDRYESARAFADELRTWRGADERDMRGERDERASPSVIPSTPSSVDVQVRDTTPVRTASRAPLIAAAVGIAGSVAIAVAFVFARDPARVAEVTTPPPVVERTPLELTRPEVPPVDDAPADTLADAPVDTRVDTPVDDVVEFEPAQEKRVRPVAASNDVGAKMASARNDLTRAMKERELIPGDVPSADSALRSRLGGPRAVTNLESALVDVNAIVIDRAFVERKLARLQARAAGRAPDAQLDNLAAGIAADIGARKYVDANRRLNRALALVR